VISWSSLLGTGATLDCSFFINGIFHSLIAKGPQQDTMQEAWAIICWSLAALWEGLWPRRDHRGNAFARGSADGKRAGEQLAGGHYGVLWVVRGDLEYLANTLKLQ
jgi:hypothetical protein